MTNYSNGCYGGWGHDECPGYDHRGLPCECPFCRERNGEGRTPGYHGHKPWNDDRWAEVAQFVADTVGATEHTCQYDAGTLHVTVRLQPALEYIEITFVKPPNRPSCRGSQGRD